MPCKRIFGFFTASCGIFISVLLPAQDVARITGKVTNAETNEPVPFASVYFNNTSIGVAADSLGNYVLKDVPVSQTDLVFSSVGYESYLTKVSLSAGQTLRLNAGLRTSKKMLNELVVTAKRDNVWKDHYDRFAKEFLGATLNAEQSEIENASALNFKNVDDVLEASASEPLKVVSHALGYRIYVTLSKFELGPSYYRILFYSRFESLTPSNAREAFRWNANRSQTYKGSLRHFLKSVITQRSEVEGFRVYAVPKPRFVNGTLTSTEPTRAISGEELRPQPSVSLPDYYQFLKRGSFEIHYLNKTTPRKERVYQDFPHPVSWLEISDEHLVFPSNGILKSFANATVSGEMGKGRLADLLPEDYDPVPVEQKLFQTRTFSYAGKISGIVQDSATGKPVPWAKVFVSGSSYSANADRNGKFELAYIPQGTYTVVASDERSSYDRITVTAKRDSIANLTFSISRKEVDRWPEEQSRKLNDLKRTYFADYVAHWHAFESGVRNPEALEMKTIGKVIQLRANEPIVVVDDKTGYKISYYFKPLTIDASRKTTDVDYVTRFDTVVATNPAERQKWRLGREGYYRGSLRHFIKSLTEGRSREEGFMFFDAEKKSNATIVGDSLLTIGNHGLEFHLQKNINVIFEGETSTIFATNSKVLISTQGAIFPEGNLSVKGSMKKKAVPVLPINYIPANERNPNPSVFIYDTDDQNVLFKMMEKPFLHTDKEYYYPGERIWYKAYMRYGVLELRDSLSRVLYVELINSRSQIVRREILKIEEGVSWGDIFLPDTLASGNYFLRAYTRWGLNFGDEFMFQKLLPVLATNQNLVETEATQSDNNEREIVIHVSKPVFKPRERIEVTVSVQENGEMINANLSTAVTDATRIAAGNWSPSIIHDTVSVKKITWKRVVRRVEKEIDFECSVRKVSAQDAASVIIMAVADGSTTFTQPDADGKFLFKANFVDTATFIFRANTKKGAYAGHVVVESPKSPSVEIPSSVPALSFRIDDATSRIKYAYNPSEKTTMLDEVVIKGHRVIESPIKLYYNSVTRPFDQAFEGPALSVITHTVSQPIPFWSYLASKIPGARADPRVLLWFNRQPAAFRVNNVPYPTDDIVNMSPNDFARIEINNLLGQVNIYLKTGQQATEKKSEYDRYTLSGYAQPSSFYMRDYSKPEADSQLPDLRTSIFWAPDLTTANGVVSFSFYAADLPGRYRIVVEGISDDGKPVHGESFVEVLKP